VRDGLKHKRIILEFECKHSALRNTVCIHLRVQRIQEAVVGTALQHTGDTELSLPLKDIHEDTTPSMRVE